MRNHPITKEQIEDTDRHTQRVNFVHARFGALRIAVNLIPGFWSILAVIVKVKLDFKCFQCFVFVPDSSTFLVEKIWEHRRDQVPPSNPKAAPHRGWSSLSGNCKAHPQKTIILAKHPTTILPCLEQAAYLVDAPRYVLSQRLQNASKWRKT